MVAEIRNYDDLIPSGIVPEYSADQLAELQELERQTAVLGVEEPINRGIPCDLRPFGSKRRLYSMYRRAMGRWPHWDHLCGLTFMALTLVVPIALAFTIAHFSVVTMAPDPVEVGVVHETVTHTVVAALFVAVLYLCYCWGVTEVRGQEYGPVMAIQRGDDGQIVAMRRTRMPRLAFAARADWGWVTGKVKNLVLVVELSQPAWDNLDLLEAEHIYCTHHIRNRKR